MPDLNALFSPVDAEMAHYRSLFAGVLRHKDALLSEVLSMIAAREGKLMRPLLVLLVAKEKSQKVHDATFRAALTVQLLHTASIVHDDVIDVCEERRGLRSVNAVHGNRIAVLAGDYLLTQATQQATLTGSLAVVECIGRLGATLAEGEFLQIEQIGKKNLSEDEYFQIIQRKTAALFSTCAELGALTSGADAEMLRVATQLGTYIGLCFQLKDDIFDYFNSPILGKPTGNDLKEGKFTLPAIYAINHYGSEKELAIVERVKGGEADDRDIRFIIDFTKQHGGIEYAEKHINELASKALHLLDAFANSAIKVALSRYIEYIVDRNY